MRHFEVLERRDLCATISASGRITYTEGQLPQILAPWATLGPGELANSDLLVNLHGAIASDRLSLVPDAHVTLSGLDLFYDGLAVGKVNGTEVTAPAPFLVTFNEQATHEAAQEVLRRIAYSNVSDDPTTKARTAIFELRETLPDETVVYHEGQRLTIRKPPGWHATDSRPAIVLFHGGGWISGYLGQLQQHASYFASRGMVAVEAEYRLVDPLEGPPLDAIEDAKSAIRWVREHAAELGVDPDRIAAGGGSAGGHLAATAGIVDGFDDPSDNLSISSKPNALVLISAVVDNGPGNYGYDLYGDQYQALSPAYNVSSDDPPVILVYGARDHLIPVETVDRFDAALDEAGVHNVFHEYPTEGHTFHYLGFRNGQRYYEVLRQADAFLAGLGWLSGPPTVAMPEAYKFVLGGFDAIGANFKRVDVRALNDPPVLSPTYSSRAGVLKVTAILTATDPDSSQLGIAVTYARPGWQYSPDNGTTWKSVPALSKPTVLLLGPNVLLRGTGKLWFRAWDRSVGSSGQTWQIGSSSRAFSTAWDWVLC